MAIASKLYVILAVGMCRLRNGRVDGGFVVRHIYVLDEGANSRLAMFARAFFCQSSANIFISSDVTDIYEMPVKERNERSACAGEM
jgi:hypothetical protein